MTANEHRGRPARSAESGSSHFLGCVVVPIGLTLAVLGGIGWQRASQPAPDPRIGQVVTLAAKHSACATPTEAANTNCIGTAIYGNRDDWNAYRRECKPDEKVATRACLQASSRTWSNRAEVHPGQQLKVLKADGDEIVVELIDPWSKTPSTGWMSSRRLYDAGD